MVRSYLTRFLTAIFLLAAAGSHAGAADPYEIHVIVSLTGQGAFVGQAHDATRLAAEGGINRAGGIRGRPVHFVIEDDKTDPALAVQLYNAVVAKHVPVVLGPSFSAPCYAVVPLVKTDIVEYCLVPSIHPPPGAYSFSGGVSTKDLAAAGIRYLRGRGFTQLGVLDTTDATGQDGDEILKENLALPENKAVKVVDIEHFSPGDITVAAQVARIRASGAQAIYTWVTGTPFGTVLHGIFDNGLDVPVLTNAGNISNPQMSQYVNFLPQQLYFTGLRFLGHQTIGPGPVRDAQTVFYSALHQALGTDPDELYGTAWDPVMIVVDALRHVGTDASAKQLHDYIEQIHGYAGINGMMDFRDGSQRGVNGDAALVVRWERATKAWIPVSKPGGAPL